MVSEKTVTQLGRVRSALASASRRRGASTASASLSKAYTAMMGTYTSFSTTQPGGKISRSVFDRSPLARRQNDTGARSPGLLSSKQPPPPKYAIGTSMRYVKSDFGIEEVEDWRAKPHYGQSPPYLRKINATVERESGLLAPLGSPRQFSTTMSSTTMSTTSASAVSSPRAYCTAYGLPENFNVRFFGLRDPTTGLRPGSSLPSSPRRPSASPFGVAGGLALMIKRPGSPPSP